ncbi:unnamed protein product [Brachionus calyciflorus]|uniref:ADP-dependent glucokinase n=1 Tax=Brachionus calyciflorus TaxID=104777 RepID=A0A814D933_9BILA|nr:unnamed protein product [Brachionus calyciflorus]
MILVDNTRFKFVFAFTTIFLAVCYPIVKPYLETYLDNLNENTILQNSNFNKFSIEHEILRAWNRIIERPRRKNKNLKIAIGMNTNVDLILSGTELFKKLNINQNAIKNHEMIENLQQFKECFLHFFRKGSAAERFFSRPEDFNHILETVKDLKKQWFIGGNAALMAQGISKRFPDADIHLIGPVGPKLKELLNENIRVPKDTLIEKDEIHLILEYEAKEMFEDIQAPQANRFIVSYDIYNSRMELLEEFFNITSIQKPDINILSGLHLLETQSSKYRKDTLEKFTSLLNKRKDKNLVHLELGSIGDKALMKTILESNLLNEVNSLGLNEQELLFLIHASEIAPHSNYFLEITGHPELMKIIDMLEWTLNTFGHSKENPYSKLTRIHFHFLMFHIIAESDSNLWSNTISSLVSGSKIAAKQACGYEFEDNTNEETLENVLEFRIPHDLDENRNILIRMDHNSTYRLNISDPVINFKRGNIKFYFTPTLVCKKPLKTVGLGDAISSNGILFAEYNNKL